MRAVLPLLLLAACEREPVDSASTTGECASTPVVQAVVGRRGTPSLIMEARRLSGARSVRRIEPGTAVTMDYRTDRLNLHVDARGVIERVNCG